MSILVKLFFGIFSSVIESVAASYILHKFGPELKEDFMKLIGKADPALVAKAPVTAAKGTSAKAYAPVKASAAPAPVAKKAPAKK